MKSNRMTRKTAGALAAAAVLLGAAGSFAYGPGPVDPYGGTKSGAGRALAAFPTIVDPNGPNSGTGRMLANGSLVDPAWPKPNSGAGRILS